jgi:hypothetical protein
MLAATVTSIETAASQLSISNGQLSAPKAAWA